MFVFYAVSKTLDSYINKSWIYAQKSLISSLIILSYLEH